MSETVSVIFPTFKRRHGLPRALDSVLARQLALLASRPGYPLVHSDEIWIRRGQRALSRLLRSGHLSHDQRAAIWDMLQRQCDILAAGACKRGNRALLRELVALRQRHRLTLLAGTDLEQVL